MLSFRFLCSWLLPSLLSRGLLAAAAPIREDLPPDPCANTTGLYSRQDLPPDPCAKIAGLEFVDPADAIACQKSFPFNETLRQNVLSVVSRVFDFYTFEDFYLDSPPPFQESTKNIRAELERISNTPYATDYDFNMDLYDLTNQLNDGHTRWLPTCYLTYQNILPAPIVLLDEGVFIAPDSDSLFDQFGSNFTDYFAAKGLDWRRLAGAKVLEIGGMPACDYIDSVARTASGNYLDHNVRVNSVLSSYQLPNGNLSQRLGDLASSLVLRQTSLKFSLIPVDSPSGNPECIDVPFVAFFGGNPFDDGPSYWDLYCAATNTTNGVDQRESSEASRSPTRAVRVKVEAGSPSEPDLPPPFLPTLPQSDGSNGLMNTYILPGNKTGVMFIGTFESEQSDNNDLAQFPADVVAAVATFQASGVTNLLIDVTNNGGGFICLGLFLHQYLAGTNFGLPGFQTTTRANPLAQKIVKSDIAEGLNRTVSVYSPDNWLFLNGTHMPLDFDYYDPTLPYVINGQQDPTSQRFTDFCPDVQVPGPIPPDPPFDLSNVVIVGNGNCASTCAIFTTLMFERHQTKIVTFGGHPDQSIEYKGMAGTQVLEWVALDTEIKTTGLKDDPLAPPDLLVNAGMRYNSRSAYSFFDENLPIAYVSEPPQFRFPYTAETYNNPEKVWTFVENQIFG
ncbi:hypothetical protein F5148DRAFT_3736 [Russula earlei]|uniref:Uncharacterized protein n=1 Tax=Russula earlei TaxID=71964 RepID=A0ACC0UP21_9AGAM|nr:hypothetical protein F5148DRAFT_3736 [Russula earlei]